MNVECGRDNFSRDLLASSKELPASKISETTETLNIYTLKEFSSIGFFFTLCPLKIVGPLTLKMH